VRSGNGKFAGTSNRGMSRLDRGERRCLLYVPTRSSSSSFAASRWACCDSESGEAGTHGDSVSGRSVFIVRTDRAIERDDFVECVDLMDLFEGLVSGGWELEKTVGIFMVYIDFLSP